MKPTRSLCSLTDDPHDGKEPKRRSHRSRSKPRRSNRSPHPHSQSTSTVAQLESVDCTFEQFDTAKYEGEVESYKSSKISDLQGIVSGKYNKHRRRRYSPKVKRLASIVQGLHSLQTLKPPTPLATEESNTSLESNESAPVCGDNCNYCTCNNDDEDDPATEPETSELHIPQYPRTSKVYTNEPTQLPNDFEATPEKPEISTSDYDPSYTGLPTEPQLEFPSTSAATVTPEEEDLEDDSEEFDIMPHPQQIPVTRNPPSAPITSATRAPEPIPFTLKEMDDWEIAFTRTYKVELELIESSTEFTPRQKVQLLNKHHTCWIMDLYEQLDRFGEMAADFETATEADRKEFLSQISQLEDKLQDAQKQLCREQGKVESLKRENARQHEIIGQLQDMIHNLKETERSRESFQKIQDYVCNTGEIEREQEKLLSILEHYKTKIERKERKMQKLSVEEHAAKLRVRVAAKEEDRIRSEISQMRGTDTSGRHDTEDNALNHFWRNV